MTFYEIFQELNTYNWAAILVILSLLVEVAPIKINPWQWIGNLLLKGVKKDIADLKSDISSVKQDMEHHIAEDMRHVILDFQNSCLNHRKHTHEEFTSIYKLCDKYERYVEKNNIPNNEAVEAIDYIRRVYRKCLDKGAFLLPQERGEEDDKESKRVE